MVAMPPVINAILVEEAKYDAKLNRDVNIQAAKNGI